MIDYNYHTHTFRCGHASGTEVDYINCALKMGMKALGFSDHIIFKESRKVLFEDYIATIKRLQEEYKDKIEIRLGFECEYLPERVEYFKNILEEKGVEYLVLGQHYIKLKNGKLGNMFNMIDDGAEACELYYQQVKEAMETGLFKYFAHPDLLIRQCGTANDRFKEYARKICIAAKENNIPLEINMNGRRKINEHEKKPGYPNEEFWKIAGEVGCEVMVGVDAHFANLICEADYKYAEELIKKYNLKHKTRLNF